MSAPVVRVVRLAFAALGVSALVALFVQGVGGGVIDAVSYFSLFTVFSNSLAAATLVAMALRPPGSRPRWLDWWRGAAAVYLTITGVVVIVLLRQSLGWVDWIDFVLHKVMPVFVVADFVLDPPRSRLSLRDAVTWVAIGLVWVAYTLIRGALVGWYPYRFMDPAVGGYGSVAITVLILVVAGAGLSVLYVTIGNRGPRSRLASEVGM